MFMDSWMVVTQTSGVRMELILLSILMGALKACLFAFSKLVFLMFLIYSTVAWHGTRGTMIIFCMYQMLIMIGTVSVLKCMCSHAVFTASKWKDGHPTPIL